MEMNVEKNLIKAHLQKTDMMIEMLEAEEKGLRHREQEIVCDLQSLYKKKEELLTLLSATDFTASLIDEDWDIHGTLTLKTKVLESAKKASQVKPRKGRSRKRGKLVKKGTKLVRSEKNV